MRILYLPNQYSQQRQFEKKRDIYPVLMAMEEEYHRQRGDEVWWNNWPRINGCLCKVYEFFDKVIYEPEGLPFLSLPHPDRVFTDAKNPKYQQNGNFKYLPGTYIQSASGCWWGKCTFCVESLWHYELRDTQHSSTFIETKDKPYLVRPVDSVIEEIKECKRLGMREVFDDSATFPQGGWLDEFLDKFTKLGKDIRFSCNWRLCDYDYSRLHRANFRMLLFGLESANQKTLDKINKGVQVEDIKYIIKAAKAGLEPHVAVMFGYPWETDDDAINTLRMVHYLLRKGYAKTAQASLYTPKRGETSCCSPNYKHRKYIGQIYHAAYNLEFWFNKLRELRSTDDIKYLWRQIKAGIWKE